jgi:hypothetical protein
MGGESTEAEPVTEIPERLVVEQANARNGSDPGRLMKQDRDFCSADGEVKFGVIHYLSRCFGGIVTSSLGMFWSAHVPTVSVGTSIDLVLRTRGSKQ